MYRSLPWCWALQAIVLLVAGIVCSLLSQPVVAWLTQGTPRTRLAGNLVFLSAPYMLGAALFTVLALMTWRVGLWRNFGRVFAVLATAVAAALWFAMASTEWRSLPLLPAALIATALAGVNIAAAARALAKVHSRRYGGGADSKPPQLWLAWLVQASVFLIGAVLAIANPSLVLSVFTRVAADSSAIDLQLARWHGVWILTIPLLTIAAMRQQKDWIWRGFAAGFSVTFAMSILAFSWAFFGTTDYGNAALLLVAPAATFLMVNLAASFVRGPRYDERLDDDDGWTLLDLAAGPLLALRVLRTKRRATHTHGVGARGLLELPADAAPGVPSHDFFTPGRRFPLLARFSNLASDDDAALDVRGCAIRLSDDLTHSPFDLLMNTGSFAPAANLPLLAAVMATAGMARPPRCIRRRQDVREGLAAGLRRAPASFAHLRYYSQTVRIWLDDDLNRHLVRFRLVPAEAVDEAGLPDEADLADPWARRRHASNGSRKDYLRQELVDRLRQGTVSFRLEAQFHADVPALTSHWYDPSIEWDSTTHPWLPLATARLTEAISATVTEELRFDPGNNPPRVVVPTSHGLFDPRSIADSEPRVVRSLQRLRGLFQRGARP